jgi:hypothetical protein
MSRLTQPAGPWRVAATAPGPRATAPTLQDAKPSNPGQKQALPTPQCRRLPPRSTVIVGGILIQVTVDFFLKSRESQARLLAIGIPVIRPQQRTGRDRCPSVPDNESDPLGSAGPPGGESRSGWVRDPRRGPAPDRYRSPTLDQPRGTLGTGGYDIPVLSCATRRPRARMPTTLAIPRYAPSRATSGISTAFVYIRYVRNRNTKY